jgi:glycosyltransferase involved in cell wall biosynthesis
MATTSPGTGIAPGPAATVAGSPARQPAGGDSGPPGPARSGGAAQWRGRAGHVALALRRLASPRRLAATAAYLAGLVRVIRGRRRETRLTIAVDADALYETLTGVGWYLFELLDHLAQRDDLRLRLYAQRLAPPGEGGPAPVVRLPAGPAIEHVTYAAPDGLVVPPWRADQLLRRAAPLLAAADRNRVLFGPNFLVPPLFRLAGGARVVTIHDLGFRRLPGAVRPDTGRALAERLERTLLEADLLLTPSLAVAGELVAAGVAPARVRPIHHGPGHRLAPSVAAVASPPAGAPAAYGLFVGTLEPRKNVATLLAAWRELRRGGGAPPLVLCGARGWRTADLRQELAAAQRDGWLHYFGYVTPSELHALYRGAAVVALPSLYEGFGLPVVEAMAAGAPLVLSDLPVFREVAGDAALYAPANRPDLWRDRLRQVLGDRALAADLVRRGAERAAHFDWRLAAAATADAWRDAAGPD